MNLFQLVLKQMRQRSLSTCLTLLSVMLGVALAVGIMILRREGETLFAQTDFGYEVLLGPPKGSPLQLTLNSVYHLDESPGLIPHALYEDMARKTPPPPDRPDYRPLVRLAVPFVVGDSFGGRRIVGTSPQMFGVDDAGQPVTGERFQYREGKSYALASGRAFAPRKFEAVIGADAAAALKLRLYDAAKTDDENLKFGGAIRVTHGMPGPNDTPDVHEPIFRVVGILALTGTANDRVIFVPYISLYAIAEHEEGLLDQALMRAKIDPRRVPADRVDEVLRQLGIDPTRVSATVRRKFNLDAAGRRAAPSTRPVGDLMRDAAVDDHAADDHDEHADDHDDHGDGHDHHHHDAYDLDANGDIVPTLPREEWQVSAIFVKTRSGYATQQLLYNFKLIEDRATAVNPAGVMREFFNTFLAGTTTVLLVIATLVVVVAAASITTSIYNSVAARQREVAILRALGATRARILAIITLEATTIGLVGGALGLAVGHLLTGAGSAYLERAVGERINWLAVGGEEVAFLVGIIALAFVAGLVPGLKAYRTSVAANLASG